mgnify:CR=1 FL=1
MWYLTRFTPLHLIKNEIAPGFDPGAFFWKKLAEQLVRLHPPDYPVHSASHRGLPVDSSFGKASVGRRLFEVTHEPIKREREVFGATLAQLCPLGHSRITRIAIAHGPKFRRAPRNDGLSESEFARGVFDSVAKPILSAFDCGPFTQILDLHLLLPA